MSDGKSLTNIAHFEQQITNIDKPQCEAFCRDILRRCALNMPVDLLREVCELVLRYRREELRREAEGN